MNDEATIEALKAVTGYDEVRRRTGYRDDGTPTYAAGYDPVAGGYAFFNALGQHCFVPERRVAELVGDKKGGKKANA